MSKYQCGKIRSSIIIGKIYILFFILPFTFSFYAHAQSSQGILPVGLNHSIYERIPARQLPAIDSIAIQRRQQVGHTKELYVGYNFKTDFSPRADDNGWGSYSKYYKSWHLKLQSKGAYGIGLVFSKVKLLPGEKLFIYNLKGMQGSFDYQSIPRSGVLPINFLNGDEVVVEFDVPINANETGTFTIETVSHAYRDTGAPHASSTSGPSRRSNNTDCYPCLEGDTLQQNKRAVLKLIIYGDGSTKVCTGTLINNTAQDKRPYVITAQHCISNEDEAQRTVFTFNYEYLYCNGLYSADNLTLSGAKHVASLYENDFSLVVLNDYPPLNYHPYYAGWDISDKEKDHVMSIHHPEGGPKKISLFQGMVTPHDFDDQTARASNGYWRISKWDAGATEGGSSGGPLFNKDRLIMGTLTGGSSECGSPFNDYFQRLSQSWEPSPATDQQLKHWLDSLSSGIKSLKGMDPFKGIISVCDTLSNLQSEEMPDLVPYTPGVGYYSGYNSANIATYAEKFSTTDSIMLTGALFWVGSVNNISPGGITVTVHQNDKGFPGASMYQTYVPYGRLVESESNYVAFYPYVNIKGTFFISYTISYSPQDTFALFQSPWRSEVENTAYVKLPQGWASIKDISPVSKGASLDIQALVCRSEYSGVTPDDTLLFSVYPNPTSSLLIVKFQKLIFEKTSLQIFDMQGRMQNVSYYNSDNNILINIGELNSGMYILRTQMNGKFYQAKFLKFK